MCDIYKESETAGKYCERNMLSTMVFGMQIIRNGAPGEYCAKCRESMTVATLQSYFFKEKRKYIFVSTHHSLNENGTNEKPFIKNLWINGIYFSKKEV
mmetsp:Transcript_51520/g.77077  ORF Transcript_51520/g.77077 Transcript_51520/m.77077 type:complete len:98 (-) Transcript_51520:293-586(-)